MECEISGAVFSAVVDDASDPKDGIILWLASDDWCIS